MVMMLEVLGMETAFLENPLRYGAQMIWMNRPRRDGA
jgi:hypothetical protein